MFLIPNDIKFERSVKAVNEAEAEVVNGKVAIVVDLHRVVFLLFVLKHYLHGQEKELSVNVLCVHFVKFVIELGPARSLVGLLEDAVHVLY